MRPEIPPSPPPPHPTLSLDAKAAFARLFQIPGGWGAIGIGGLMWMLFPLLFIPPLIAMGWMVHYGRGVARGDATLPPWKFSYVSDGFKWVAVNFVYNLPLWLVMIPLYISMMGSIGSFDSSSQFDPGFGELMGRQFLVTGIAQLWSLALTAIMPAVAAIMIRTDSFSDCFRPTLIKAAIRPFGSNYAIAPLLVFVAGLGGGLGIILCCVGVFFTLFYSQSVLFGFAGQIAAAVPDPGRAPLAPTV